MRASVHNVTLAVVVLIAGLGSPSLLGQHRPIPGPKPKPARPAPAARPTRPNGEKAAPANPEFAIDRWNAMSARDQQKALERLPPERRQKFLDSVGQFNKLPEEEKEWRRERVQKLNNLPPQMQNAIRQDWQQLSSMPLERRRPINQELARLRNMTDEQRQARLNSDDFRRGFSPADQQMVRDLSQILPSAHK